MAAEVSLNVKPRMKILVIGHNGSGKSSVINEMVAKKVAKVGRPEDPTPHDPIEAHNCTIGDVDVTIFDTRGFGDPSVTDKKTMEAVTKIKTVDVVLICHKLYGRVDDATEKELKVLVDRMGNDSKGLIDLSVFVFTFGDDYLSRCDPEFTNDGRLTEESKVQIKDELVAQQAIMEHKLKEKLRKIVVDKKVVNRIPSCISCGKRKKNGKQKELPTSSFSSCNWIEDLWDLCEQRCKPEARPFVRSMKSTIINTLVMGGLGGGAVGAVVGGVASGIEAGATLGTAATPGVGTVAGAVVGGVIAGAIAGGIYGVGAAGVGAAVVGIGVAAAGIGARVVEAVKGKSDKSN
ncbi:PREDICTED: uncharacterized protein LOC105314594 [Amphimedon queenslandica]|uniref:G domain-containing protein n=1 Tax=Amphimedon queenslandica TaxID=400682 RepID=A0A1X7TNM5_AMPQE|nr:PREDICTED: uncharacterized protein LOC105314594 [Amphimedon queenslandica]|eukprot:XP_011407159.1 PREDICTED: uncharacterized protein LOC105314594 [Amphimedon queenslandica]